MNKHYYPYGVLGLFNRIIFRVTGTWYDLVILLIMIIIIDKMYNQTILQRSVSRHVSLKCGGRNEQ